MSHVCVCSKCLAKLCLSTPKSIVPLSVERVYRAQHSHHFRRPPRRIGLCAPSSSTEAGFPEKAPEASRRCTRRRGTATSRLRSCCSPKAPRWTPRRTTAGASNAGKQAPDIEVSPTWAPQKAFPGYKFLHFSGNVWQNLKRQSCIFRAKIPYPTWMINILYYVYFFC